MKAVADFVGKTFSFQLLHKRYHFWNVIGCPADDVGAQDVKCCGISQKKLGEMFGNLPRIPAGPTRPHHHPILAFVGIRGEMPHIGDIHHLFDFVAQVVKDPADGIGFVSTRHISTRLFCR